MYETVRKRQRVCCFPGVVSNGGVKGGRSVQLDSLKAAELCGSLCACILATAHQRSTGHTWMVKEWEFYLLAALELFLIVHGAAFLTSAR